MSPFDSKSVQHIRSGLGFTQRDFAKHMGVTQSTVHRWESGVSQPNANHLGQMHDLAIGQGLAPSFFGTIGSRKDDF